MKKKDALEEYIKSALEMYCFMKDPQPRVPYLPTNIYIEITNACNLRCIMCGWDKMTRRIGIIKLPDFRKVIDNLVKGRWLAPITIIGHGEPLMNKNVVQMIKYAKSKGLNVSLISNSTLLNEQKTKQILQSGLDRYQTMFDSLEKKSFEKLRPRADYDKTKANIINLIKMNEKMGHPVFVSIGTVRTSLTKKINQTKEFWKSLPIDNFYESPLLSGLLYLL